MARQVEDLKMNSFKTNEANIKLKKELTKVSKDLVTATEEKEVAENEYVIYHSHLLLLVGKTTRSSLDAQWSFLEHGRHGSLPNALGRSQRSFTV